MTPRRLSKSSAVFFTFAAVAVASTAVSLVRGGFGERAHARFTREQRRVEAHVGTTRAVPSTDPWCTHDDARAPLFATFRAAEADADQATHSVARGDRAGAARAVVRVLDDARRIEERRSVVASLMAAKLVERAADVVERDRALVEDPDVARALLATKLPTAARPLEPQRERILEAVVAIPGSGRIPSTSLTRAAAGVVLAEVDGTVDAMQEAVLAGDLRRCEATAASASRFARLAGIAPTLCGGAARTARAGARLHALRGSVARAHHAR